MTRRDRDREMIRRVLTHRDRHREGRIGQPDCNFPPSAGSRVRRDGYADLELHWLLVKTCSRFTDLTLIWAGVNFKGRGRLTNDPI